MKLDDLQLLGDLGALFLLDLPSWDSASKTTIFSAIVAAQIVIWFQG